MGSTIVLLLCVLLGLFIIGNSVVSGSSSKPNTKSSFDGDFSYSSEYSPTVNSGDNISAYTNDTESAPLDETRMARLGLDIESDDNI